ncbi:MAG: hypothetical protein V2I97_20245, partial [Desulfococcaceae bacterium]|nr:hypothetical protein [Desulfococcaceae bacterium]
MRKELSQIEMSSFRRYGFAFVLLFLSVFLIYSNTFNATWHFDDYPNIVHNPYLHIQELNAESLIQSLFAHPNGQGKKMYRPVACVSFAINWYLGQENVYGYHLVNILIHFFTSFILFLATQNLLSTPNAEEKYAGRKYFISLLTAVLWAVHPIQTQAVTYIVQRMASLAAMFYILGIYFYLKFRFNDFYTKRLFFLSLCVVSFALALGSKENAITFPMALILMEVIFFQKAEQKKTGKILAGAVFICLLSVILITFQISSPFSFLEAYENRPFTLSQRLMTEARIIVFYISLLFYPAAHRFSLVHDVEISTALYKPLTTFPSVMLL